MTKQEVYLGTKYVVSVCLCQSVPRPQALELSRHAAATSYLRALCLRIIPQTPSTLLRADAKSEVHESRARPSHSFAML